MACNSVDFPELLGPTTTLNGLSSKTAASKRLKFRTWSFVTCMCVASARRSQCIRTSWEPGRAVPAKDEAHDVAGLACPKTAVPAGCPSRLAAHTL